MTNYERIKQMSIDEMAKFFAEQMIYGDCTRCGPALDVCKFEVGADGKIDCKIAWKRWLSASDE